MRVADIIGTKKFSSFPEHLSKHYSNSAPLLRSLVNLFNKIPILLLFYQLNAFYFLLASVSCAALSFFVSFSSCLAPRNHYTLTDGLSLSLLSVWVFVLFISQSHQLNGFILLVSANIGVWDCVCLFFWSFVYVLI